MKHLSFAVFALSLVLATSACGFSLAAEAVVLNRCSSNSDCGDSESCDTTRGMCVGRAETPLRVALELVPSNSSSSAGAIFSTSVFTVDGEIDRNLVLPDPLLVWGQVRWTGHGDENVPVQVSIITASAIPGRISPTVSAPRATAGFHPELLDTSFVANVGAQGDGPTQFDVIVQPTGDAVRELPPRRIHVVADNLLEGAFEVPSLDYPESLVEIVGDVVDTSGNPLAGLTVQALDPISNTVVSSTATTQPLGSENPGRFTIRLAPEASSYVLRIASANTALTPVPTFAVSPDYLIPEDGVVRVQVNSSAAFEFRGIVERELSHMPVPSALVQFRMVGGSVEDGMFISAPVPTNADGEFSALLVEGDYEIVIMPPSDSTDGHDRIGISVVENVHIALPSSGLPVIMGQVFSLPERAFIEGLITTFDGRPMIGAVVSASALSRLLPTVGPEALLNRSNQTVSAENGGFFLPLDLGAYDLTVKPPPETGFPWVVRTNFTIPPSLEPTGSDSDELMFTAPIPLQGVVRDVFGTPLAGIEVRAFGILDDLDAGTRSVQIGRTVSEVDGSYELLLPPSL